MQAKCKNLKSIKSESQSKKVRTGDISLRILSNERQSYPVIWGGGDWFDLIWFDLIWFDLIWFEEEFDLKHLRRRRLPSATRGLLTNWGRFRFWSHQHNSHLIWLHPFIKVAKLNKILAQVVQLEEGEGVVENDFWTYLQLFLMCRYIQISSETLTTRCQTCDIWFMEVLLYISPSPEIHPIQSNHPLREGLPITATLVDLTTEVEGK